MTYQNAHAVIYSIPQLSWGFIFVQIPFQILQFQSHWIKPRALLCFLPFLYFLFYFVAFLRMAFCRFSLFFFSAIIHILLSQCRSAFVKLDWFHRISRSIFECLPELLLEYEWVFPAVLLWVAFAVFLVPLFVPDNLAGHGSQAA